MLTIITEVDAPPGQAQGIKEHLAMCLEQFGDCRVVEVRVDEPEQMRMEWKNGQENSGCDLRRKNDLV